jgi:hypothetical protein
MTSGNICATTRRHISEDWNSQQHRCENLRAGKKDVTGAAKWQFG